MMKIVGIGWFHGSRLGGVTVSSLSDMISYLADKNGEVIKAPRSML